ncbi:butyrophilin subfamily 3 member A2-like [Melanerpes formicivorus]|uniref:butyrophilin subfamily 3 member A2-like n=1 Tax=Melanerpes formicivorus TaxID=211600 RepID=UPI00358E1371
MELSGVHLIASSFFWLLMSPLQPTAGGVPHPLLVLDGYEDDGIRLKCLSERLFADVQVLWRSGGGEDVLGTPLSNSSTANASSSLVLKPGSGNSVSCKVIDKVLRTSTESSVVIADVFFPSTSPWLAAFIVILLLILLLVLSALYKIRVYKKIAARESKSQLVICGAARGPCGQRPPGGHQEEGSRAREVLLPICSAHEVATAGGLGPVLGPPVQEGLGATGESPVVAMRMMMKGLEQFCEE